jgi:hypothetical protein
MQRLEKSASDQEASDARDLVLASLPEALEFFAASSLARFLVIGLASHFLAQTAPLAELAEAADRFLDGFTSTDP